MKLILSALLCIIPSIATGHDAPMGWSYSPACCSTIDCRMLQPGDIAETKDGYVVKLTGEVIPYGDSRVKQSQDDAFHQCTPGGVVTATRSICLYVPNRGF